MLVCVSIFWFIHKEQNKKSRLKIYYKLSEQDQTILKSIALSKGIPTSTTISKAYEKLTNNQIEQSQLQDHLKQMSKIGLIQQKIFTLNDHPYLGWQLLFALEKNRF